ncbi:hypothetical protein BDFG_09285, partial [Blastomyces dermatitidis ATCC 26199]
IELLRVTVLRIKLFPGFSLNDHTGLYATVLAGRGGRVTTAMRGAEDESDTDTLTGRITAAAREAGGGVIMRAVLPRLIDVTIFNLAFLAVMKTAAASQRCLLTRKCQNKPSTVLQE